MNDRHETIKRMIDTLYDMSVETLMAQMEYVESNATSVVFHNNVISKIGGGWRVYGDDDYTQHDSLQLAIKSVMEYHARMTQGENHEE